MASLTCRISRGPTRRFLNTTHVGRRPAAFRRLKTRVARSLKSASYFETCQRDTQRGFGVLDFEATDLPLVLKPRGDYTPFFSSIKRWTDLPIGSEQTVCRGLRSIMMMMMMMMILGLYPFISFLAERTFPGVPISGSVWRDGAGPLWTSPPATSWVFSSGNWVATLKTRNERRGGADDVSGELCSPCHIPVDVIGCLDFIEKLFINSCIFKGSQNRKLCTARS